MVLAALHGLAPRSAHVAVEALADADVGSLTAAEHELIFRATIERQLEFAAGRVSARRALASLGHPEWSIVRGARGEPLWPACVVGSITHAAGIAAAAVAPASATLTSLGIDVEFAESLDRSMWPSVLLPDEQIDCERSGSPTQTATAFFSTKEAVIKAHYPVSGVALDFRDIRLRVDPLGEERLTAWHASPHAANDLGNPTRLGAVRRAVVGDVVVSVAVVP